MYFKDAALAARKRTALAIDVLEALDGIAKERDADTEDMLAAMARAREALATEFCRFGLINKQVGNNVTSEPNEV